MNTSVPTGEVRDTLRDFTADRRMLMLCAMALVTGTFGAMAAWALVKLIALCSLKRSVRDLSSVDRTPGNAARLTPDSRGGGAKLHHTHSGDP